MKIVSIIIPCFNEAKTIEKLLKKIEQASVLNLKKEIIIINDGSTDGTSEVLKKYSSKIKIISFPKNIGKSFALKKGFEISTGDIVLTQDADLEYNPQDYESLIKPILKNNSDVVYGSRRMVFSFHFLVNKFLTLFSNILTGLKLDDMETGYKAFKGDIIRSLTPNLESKRFGFEPEITAKLAKNKNIKISQVPISYNRRSYKEGKHITWKDGLKTIWDIIKYNV